jgi:hypothetical protein
MGVSMDPMALDGGATRFAGQADTLAGHTATLADLAALRAAFGTIGAQAFEGVAARLAEITGGIEAARERTARAGEVLGAAARGSATIDQRSGAAVQNSGAAFDTAGR